MSLSVPALREIYTEPEALEAANRWADIHFNAAGPERLVEQLGSLGTAATSDELLGELESIDYNDGRLEAALKLLGSLPAHRLLDEFGEEVTAFVIGNDQEYRSQQRMHELEEEGYSSRLLWQARLLAESRERLTVQARDLLAHNRVMETVLGISPESIDLSQALQASLQPVKRFKPGQQERYGLVPLEADTNTLSTWGRVRDWPGKDAISRSGLKYDMWLDTPVGCAVTYRSAPQVLLGLYANGEDEIFIRQMQGVQGEIADSPIVERRPSRGLGQLDWRQLLVHISAQIGRQIGLRSVGITTGKDVPHPRYNFLTQAQARQLYDVQAERLGFHRGERHWHKPIDQILTQD